MKRASWAICCLLLAAIAINNASAARNYRSSSQYEGEEGPYEHYSDKGPYGHGDEVHEPYYEKHEDKPYYEEHDEHEGHGHEGYGEEPHHEEHEGYYEHEPKIDNICLLKTKSEKIGGVFIDTFRCCEEEDSPKACLYNSSYPAPYKKGGYRKNDELLFDAVLSPKTAAVCKSAILPIACPSFITAVPCLAFQTNCTLYKPSKECGCPAEEEDIINLTGTTYGYSIPAMTCRLPAAEGGGGNSTKKQLGSPAKKAKATEAGQRAAYYYEPEEKMNPVYVGAGFKIQGKVTAVVGRGYYGKELKGSLEIIDQFTPQTGVTGGLVTAPTPLPDLPLFTPGQMFIRLVEDEHY